MVFAEDRDTIRRLVAEHGMTNPRPFGYVLHGDDIGGSDLDILMDVPPAPACSTSSSYNSPPKGDSG